jgi:metallo-beta-lactamase class B
MSVKSKTQFLLGITLIVAIAAAGDTSAQTGFPQSVIDGWNKPFKSFRIIDDIYYVGTSDLACFLLTTPSGHILIDTALQQSAPILRENIASLGFKVADIRIILSGHAHFDHVAGHADMKSASGAQVFASAADAIVLESGGKKGFHPLGDYKPVKVDRIIKDGDTVTLGKWTLTAHLTPGHTEGNTTWTTTVNERGKRLNVVFAGSMSINPGVRMINNPTWPGIREAYATSFATLKSLPCDVFLGPHAPFFDMEAKVPKIGSGKANPFIDPAGYQRYINRWEKDYLDQIAKERAESK